MSPLQQADRLDELAAVIRDLRTRVLDLERTAGDLSGDDAETVHAGAEAFMAKARLDAAIAEYFDLSELARDRQCPIHGEPAAIPCIDCIRILDRSSHQASLGTSP